MKITTNFSLALNALLAGGVLWLACAGARPELRGDFTRFLTNRVLRVKPQPAPPAASEPVPEIVETTAPFHWGQLETADYRIYLANLRGIGCPETTVRDILIADVNELFNARVKALVDEVSGQFWHYLMHEKDFEKLINEKGQQLRELDHERGELFATLFGNENPRAEENQRASVADNRKRWEQIGDFLPLEKRAQFATAKEELERARTDFLRAPDQNGTQQQAKRKELEAAHDQALSEWLTPDELAELRLRQAPAANLRERLVGMNLSAEEVRAVANIQLATDEAWAALSQQDADFKSRTTQLQQQAEAQTRELLSPEVFAAFQRAIDNRYEPIYRVTQRLELPDSTAAQAFDIRRQAEEAASRLGDDKSLAAEDRQARLQAIGAEAKRSLATALGARGFAAYETIDSSDWLRQMSAPRP
jgi:hypothetical protein